MHGNEQVFDSIVDPIANKQVIGLAEDLAVLDKQAVDTARSINLLNTATSNSKTFAELQKNAAAAEIAQKKATDNIEKTRLAEIKLQQAREKSIDSYNKKLAQQEAAQARSAKQVTLSNGEYAKLIASYNAATLAARNAGVQFGANSIQFTQAAEKVKSIRTQLDAVDQPLGNFQRNVGNYANSIGGLLNKAFSGIRLLANIIPNFGIGTFFLALGTGIGFAAEKIGILDFVTEKLGLKVAQSVKNQKALNEVYAESDKQAGEQLIHLQYLYKAATDVTNSSKDRLLAVNELQKEFPNYFKNISDETILNGGAKKSYDELNTSIIENARALSAANKIAELRGKLLDTDVQKAKIRAAEGNELIKLQQDIKSGKYDLSGTGEQGGSDILADKTAKNSHERAVKAIKDQDDLANGYKATIKVIEQVVGGATKIGNALAGDSDNTPKDKIAKSEKPLYEEYLKALKLREEAILGNEKSSYGERLKAVNDYFNDAYDLTKKYSDKGVLTQIETNNKLTEFDVDTNKSRIKVREDAEKELAKLIRDGLKGQEDAERASIELIQSAGDEKVLTQAQNAADAEQALAEQYSKGLITQREYQIQLTAIEDEADIDRLDQEIVTAQAIIDVRKGLLSFGIGSAKELQSAEDKLANLKLARTKAGTKAVLDGVKDEAQARQQLHDKEKQLADASINLIQSVVDGGYARQLEALQQVSKQVDDNATKEKDAVNSSLLSAKDKADKNAVIDAKTQLQKEQIAIREKEIKRDQAEFDRAIAIARIIEETAVGIVTALTIPIGGIALASVIGALGAVQLATVLATPLPAFKDGGVTGGGHILWGEAGMEKATLPGGQVQYSNGPTIQDFPKGTIITPHLELMKSIKPDAVKYAGGQEVPWREVLSELRKNRPTKQKGRIIINNNTDHNTIRKNYFK